MRKGSSRALRRLLVLPVAFALAVTLVMPVSAFAAEEGTAGYGTPPSTATTPPAPATTPPTPTPAPTPKSETSPSKEKSTPTQTTAPEKTKSEPTTTSPEPTATTAAKKATSLPFTGFDLRWTIGAGLLLMAMGFSLVTAQRRQRRNGSR